MKTTTQMYVTERAHEALLKESDNRGGTVIAFIVNEWADKFLEEGNPTAEELQAIAHDVASRGKNKSKPIRSTFEINDKLQEISKAIHNDKTLNMVKVMSLIVNRYGPKIK